MNIKTKIYYYKTKDLLKFICSYINQKSAKFLLKYFMIAFVGAFILVPMLAGLAIFYIGIYRQAITFITNPTKVSADVDKVTVIYREKGKIELTDKLLDIYVKNIEVTIKDGTLADKKNNPCNLVYAGQPYAKKDGRFAVFTTKALGIRACIRQVAYDQTKGFSLQDFISKFAPPFENDTATYIKQISEKMHCTPETKIKDLDTIELATAMAFKESQTKVIEKF